MKKTKALLFAVIIAVVTLTSTLTAFGWVGDSYESPEIAFTSIMNEMSADFGYEYESYTYTSAPTYNLSGSVSGYVYDFTLDEVQDGYILMTRVEYENITLYEVTEIFFNSHSPFYDNAGINIYPTFLKYYSLLDGAFYELTTDTEVTAEEVVFYEDWGFGFNGTGLVTYPWSESFNYSSVVPEENKIVYGFPDYVGGVSGQSDTCAVTAGKNIITYWNYLKPNLIPGFNSIRMTFGSKYYWAGETTAIEWVPNELYTRMGTNTTGAGTTISQFKNGITSFASAHGGYGVNYRSTMTSGYYDINKMVAEFQANRPVVLFLTPKFNYHTYIHDQNYTSHGGSLYESAHTMVAFGRQKLTYYDSYGSVMRRFDMLMVAGCRSGMYQGFVRMNEGYLDIYDSFGIEIY